MATFLDSLKVLAQTQPDSPAISLGKSTLTFGELWRNIELVAGNASRLNFEPGTRFVFACKPTPKSISLALGLTHAGLTLCFLDPFTALNSFDVRVKLVDPSLVLAESSLFTIGSKKLKWLRKLLKISVADFGSIAGAKFFYSGARLPLMPQKAKPAIEELLLEAWQSTPNSREPETDSIIVFTSGTTADPKGVVHSLESISANFAETAKIFDFTHNDRVLCEPMTVGLVAISVGAQWLIPAKGKVDDFNKFFGVPTDALKLLDEIEAKSGRPHEISVFGMGGAPIPPSLVNRVIQVLGENTTIPCIYGMTELLPVAACEGKEKLTRTDGDLLGRPLPGVEFSFAPDSELLIKGSGLMKRYLGRQAEAWHATGDLAKVDATGQLVMLARKKNMLIRGDMNVYPSLYEPGITMLPGVADAVIVGVPDKYHDDRIVLFVVPDKDSTDVEALKRSVQKSLPALIDRDAMPDLTVVIKSLPVSGRGQKRDMAALSSLARTALDEIKKCR